MSSYNQDAGPEGDRRQVTVLFADLVGFTAFSERSGEEAAYKLMQRIAKLLREAVQEHGGAVSGFTGDGIMALFGVPQALEDAPLRACRAALLIQERPGRWAGTSTNPTIAAAAIFAGLRQTVVIPLAPRRGPSRS